MYRHIFWDFDGTLFNTYPVMAEAFCEALAENGHTEPREEIMRQMRISFPHAFAYYRERYGVGDRFFARFDELRREREPGGSRPFPDAPDLLRAVCENGGRNYLYTHKDKLAVRLLEKYKLLQYFADCVTGDDGFARKPSPDALLYLLRKHGVDPAAAAMVGDRELDVLCAKNAGIAGCLLSSNPAGTVADFTVQNLKGLYRIFKIRYRPIKQGSKTKC